MTTMLSIEVAIQRLNVRIANRKARGKSAPALTAKRQALRNFKRRANRSGAFSIAEARNLLRGV